MRYRNHCYIFFMVISFVLVSCDLGSDTKNDDDLPPLYFSTWDPTATPTHTPTPTLIPTKTPTPVPTSTPIPSPTQSPKLAKLESRADVDEILKQVRDIMALVSSYSYEGSGVAVMDAGGIPLTIPIQIFGQIQDDKALSFLEVSFLGINTRMDSMRIGDHSYVKDVASGDWVYSSDPSIGLIPPDFWVSAGGDILSLPFASNDRLSDKGNSGKLLLTHSSESEIPVLLSLLGAEGTSEPFDLEDIILEIKVDVEDLTVTDIMAMFTVSQGGRFASEMLGFPGLSGIGPVEIDLLTKFGNYDENFGIEGPAK